MISFAEKARVINECEDIMKLQKRWHFLQYLRAYLDADVFDEKYLAEYTTVQETVFSFLRDEEYKLLFKECDNINHAEGRRIHRLSSRIERMLTEGACVFLTLTFTDETFNNTSEQTRRRYVARYLSSVSNNYVANKDFGKNEREHYHAVVCADNVDMSSWQKYGFAYAERVRNVNDYKRLAKYTAKLTNHAIKETAKRSHIIYSKTK